MRMLGSSFGGIAIGVWHIGPYETLSTSFEHAIQSEAYMEVPLGRAWRHRTGSKNAAMADSVRHNRPVFA
jgi:hypothetical protein